MVDGPRPSHRRVRWIFLRLLALAYLAAFVSFWVQAEGLVGPRGILPISELLTWVRARTGAERYLLLPTVFWLGSGKAALHLVCAAGTLLSLLLLAGIAPIPVLLLLWAAYLSVVSTGQVFMGYQWDALLLETGLLAVLIAPGGLRPRLSREREVPRLPLWSLRVLLFRLMFASGLVKLLSGDAAWRSLTALRYHYETQPLPTWIGWYAHQLPRWFQTFSCAAMFAIELPLPFLIFAPRRLRFTACGGLVLLQVLIALTGNYAFFNGLSVALCLLLLDDRLLAFLSRGRLPEPDPPAASGGEAGKRRWADRVRGALAAVLLLLALVPFSSSLGLRFPWPTPLLWADELAAPFRSVNGYGLFAVMTTRRPEIQVEGSDDGEHWRSYRFRYKPGDPGTAPGFVAPHQPRLDWQMWFAALGRCEGNPWFVRFEKRLLEGSLPVLGLLAENPFPEHPPRLIRSVLYDYRFTDLASRRHTGAWWRRERLGPYCPVVSKDDLMMAP